jgi:hypothetical protein
MNSPPGNTSNAGYLLFWAGVMIILISVVLYFIWPHGMIIYGAFLFAPLTTVGFILIILGSKIKNEDAQLNMFLYGPANTQSNQDTK